MKRLDYYWYRQSPWLLLLWPVSLLFCSLVLMRRFFYRFGLLRSYRMPVPVIVVGNITVGGSGKTPLVLWLAEFLRQQGFRPGLISRGYGGKADNWPQNVDADSDPTVVGDEAVMLARNSGCPMVVGPDRVAAARQLLDTCQPDVIIADDGMQHYRLQRDVEIAVIDGERRLANGMCLPAGPLREPASRLKQVDFVVANGQAAGGEWHLSLLGTTAQSMHNDDSRSLSDFGEAKVHAVAGIGNPERFFGYLRDAGLEVIPHAYPDHYPYQRGELEFDDKLPVLMTEKDAVKYFAYADRRHWYLPVKASLPEAFGDRLRELVERYHG